MRPNQKQNETKITVCDWQISMKLLHSKQNEKSQQKREASQSLKFGLFLINRINSSSIFISLSISHLSSGTFFFIIITWCLMRTELFSLHTPCVKMWSDIELNWIWMIWFFFFYLIRFFLNTPNTVYFSHPECIQINNPQCLIYLCLFSQSVCVCVCVWELLCCRCENMVCKKNGLWLAQSYWYVLDVMSRYILCLLMP